MFSLKVTRVGSSMGFILPKAMADRLKIQKGDKIYLTEAPDKSYRITAYNPDFERQINLAEEIMRQDRDLLHKLAK